MPSEPLFSTDERLLPANRGRLKVFFGASTGVGKTYAALSAAQQRFSEGVDVVIGYAEPHARPQTEALLIGMEVVPMRYVEFRGGQRKEMDLDAVLRRSPELVVVDELAHTNAPGMRHIKRWQDVDELLSNGIDVYTTLNVHHLESLNDVVTQVTGVHVSETLPDAVFDRADEVELIDLSPEDLLRRFEEGKILAPGDTDRAMRGMFRQSNLTALRELALRRMADRVNVQVQHARREQSANIPWPTAERIMVSITWHSSSARIIRATKRIATALHAQWIAVFVQTPSFGLVSKWHKEQLYANFKLAESLGAQTATLDGLNIADELISYARDRNITKIVLGKPRRTRLIELILGSEFDQLIRRSGEIDLFIIREPSVAAEPKEPGFAAPRWRQRLDWRGYAMTLAFMAMATLLCSAMESMSIGISNFTMVYMLTVAAVAARYGRIASVLASVSSSLLFNYFFAPPKFEFAFHEREYIATFIAMTLVGLLIGYLTSRIREQAQASRTRERRTEALYFMTRRLASIRGVNQVIIASSEHLAEAFGASCVFFLPDEQNRLSASTAQGASTASDREIEAASWVFARRIPAGPGTDTLPEAKWSLFPLVGSSGTVGVLGIHADNPGPMSAPESRQLLEAFTNQVAAAVEREVLSLAAQRSQVEAQAQRLRNSLLSSVSHDLRTPLAVIKGASRNLLEEQSKAAPDQNAARRHAIVIGQESTRLTRLVANLLDVTKLESGSLQLNREPQPLEDLIGSALHYLEEQLVGREVRVDVPKNLPLVNVDDVLIDQVLVNLIENVLRHAGPDSPVELAARVEDRHVIVEVADRGGGIAIDQMDRVFDKFFRGNQEHHPRGSGLGLCICKGIIEAHGQRIWASNREPDAQGRRGAAFRFTLPAEVSGPEASDAGTP